LAPLVKFITAFDRSEHMLEVARTKLLRSGLQNWQLDVSEHLHVPVVDRSVDLVISGWSICYTVLENNETWKSELVAVLDEMLRMLRPGGSIILLETLGTGFEQPQPPADLLPYYKYLESLGFEHSWIRTDYRFQDYTEAQNSTRFFFGEDMAGNIREGERGVVLPECTGIWWLIKE
jgi:ubiquinone/menaquinone biosynthesis C-methylase UbiE